MAPAVKHRDAAVILGMGFLAGIPRSLARCRPAPTPNTTKRDGRSVPVVGATERRRGERRLIPCWGVMLLSAFVLVACGSDKDGAADATAAGRLDGRRFLSQSIDGHVLVPGTQIRLSFDGDQIGAQAGCNSLGAAYQVRDGRLLIVGDGLTTTDMGCDPPRHAQDEWLSDLLQSTPRIDLDGDTLTLAAADATLHLLDRVVADPDRPLVGTRWRVDTTIRGDAASSVPADSPVMLEFHVDGTLTATSIGCTSADVEVDVEGDTVRFGEFVIDAIGCPAPWEATVELLRAGDARYSITAARLTLTAGDVGIAAVAG